MFEIGLSILIVLLFLVFILVMKTLQFRPPTFVDEELEPIDLNEAHILASMKAMVRFKTVSYIDKSKEDPKPFEQFKSYLQKRYAWIESHGTWLDLGPRSLLIHIKGASSSAPLVLMSHYDVVPQNGTWEHDPFLGDVLDDRLYGRGTLDNKATLCSIMESLKHLIEDGHTFAQDVYVAFAGDEEIRGGGADTIVDELSRRGIVPGLVLDEGGAIVENSFPGIKQPMAVIGTAEKGFMSVQLIAHDQGGHASTPKAKTAVTVLAKAVTLLNQKKLFPIQRNVVMDQMFDTLGRHAQSFMLRMVFANLWLTFPLIRTLAKKQGGQFAAMLKTTQAFTMMEGSEAINVLPSKATVGINYRISLREDADKIEQKLRRALKHLPLEIDVEYATDPTPASLTDATYEKLTRTIRKVWDNAIPSPYLMMAATDARYHHRISDHVYRFSPMALTQQEFAMIHGENESIHVDNLFKMVRFYSELIRDFT